MIHLMTCYYRAGDLVPVHFPILWRIARGLVQIVTIENGKPITLAILGVGEMFGAALSDVSPCYASCLTDVKVEVIPCCLCRYLLFPENSF
jgi:CRP-like cAMP-binding protein